jgi:hypothetical protein
MLARALADVLAAAPDTGAARATVARIVEGDPDSWLREWTAAGGAAWAAARRAPSAALYLHAAACYAAALAAIADTDGTVDERTLWERQRDCWDRAVPLLGGEALSVPYQDTRLPGYFFAAGDAPAPAVVIDPGGRLSPSHALARGGAAAHAAGLHWMTFDGPGRQAALVRQGLALRPDWEAVLTPVADALLDRPDVQRLGVIGLEHAAYGVVRALAFEPRFAAAVVEPGVVDAAAPWLAGLPPAARDALLDADRNAFGRELHIAGLFDPGLEARLRRRGRWYDASGATTYDLYRRIAEFRLGAEVERIRTPVFVAGGADEPFWPGQSAALYERLHGPKARGSAAAAADWLARTLRSP